MKYRTRTYYNDAQKAMMWERWKQGCSVHAEDADSTGMLRGLFSAA